MKKIDGIAKSIHDVLQNNRFSIDYYQREYRWESKQVAELLNDLAGKFSEAWDPSHERDRVEQYPYYFLGSIIISEKDSVPYIVDGQQRLTSLTLLLIFLRHLQEGRDDHITLDSLLRVRKFGRDSYNLDVPDRNRCMAALIDSGSYMPTDEDSESVRTLAQRYVELDDLFPAELRGDALPFFIEWLIHRVQIVQITAYTDDDAYSIFETMNDRGLKLTPADMLKGYLLANVADGEARIGANELWRTRMRQLADLEKDGDSDFLKTWLRSQYADKIRERRRGAIPEDWDRIGTEFHRWLRGRVKDLGLVRNSDFENFIRHDLDFYSRQYARVVNAAAWRGSEPELRFVGFNADRGFTLQHQILLAPLLTSDSDDVLLTKMELVGRYIDIMLAWRIWNYRSIAYSQLSYAMFITMRDVRGLAIPDLAARLHEILSRETETFDTEVALRVHQQNRFQLNVMLARLTDYITVESGGASCYRELMGATGIPYEVEHIWANHFDRHRHEFDHPSDFATHRNLIGDLLLLPKQFNASFGDLAYHLKLPHYLPQNLLARSLHQQAYERHPGFGRFVTNSGLDFKPYESFTKDSILERGELYRQVAKRVWNPADLLEIANSSQQ